MLAAGFIALLLVVLPSLAAAAPSSGFTHPGLLHTQADLARMRAAIAAQQEPVFSSFEKLHAHPSSDPAQPTRQPAAEIGRNPSVNHAEFDADATAAYQLALLWCLTGDAAFARRARAIVDGWSATLQRVTGADAVLMAGLGPFKLVNAAELLRHSDSGWPAAHAARTEEMLRRAIVPTLRDFAPFANGNWDTAALKTLAAIAVFCDDRDLFEHTLRYYVDGHGDGALTHYIIDATGQCQESGRDMAHAQLGLAHLADTCEIAWNQGLDLYAYAGDRLLRGFEYSARYNLGHDVPFTPTIDRTGKYRHRAISPRGRGKLRPIYEQVFHHYAHRAGVSAPWTQRAAEKLRPESSSHPHADHTGFGTLLYTVAPDSATVAPRAAPAGLTARASADTITLTWIRPRNATNFIITRTSDTAPPQTFNTTETTFTDRTVTATQLYRYQINAAEGPRSAPISIAAGLPAPWKNTDLGRPPFAGVTSYDGTRFTLEAAGHDVGGAADEALFVHAAAAPTATLAARYVPQVSSQLGKFGLALRRSTAANAPAIGLLIVPDNSRQTEHPAWSVQLVARETAAAATRIVASLPLTATRATYGRLTQPHWLRLARDKNEITAGYSADGFTWSDVGSISLDLGADPRLGLVACSRIPQQTSIIRFDHVSLSRIEQ